jgi:hypothetical protein
LPLFAALGCAAAVAARTLRLPSTKRRISRRFIV